MPIKRALVVVATLALFTIGWAAEKADVGKYDVEAPTKRALKNFAVLPPNVQRLVEVKIPKKPKLDIGKGFIEGGAERLLAAPDLKVPQPVAQTRPAAWRMENPKVEPGKVRWHTDFAAACAAGRKSQKPVLLFQMMGNLDDRFC